MWKKLLFCSCVSLKLITLLPALILVIIRNKYAPRKKYDKFKMQSDKHSYFTFAYFWILVQLFLYSQVTEILKTIIQSLMLFVRHAYTSINISNESLFYVYN